MLHRIALLAASVVAALVIAGGLALSGFGPQQPVADAVQVVDAVAGPADAAAPDATVQVDPIYLAPQATPEVIDETQVKEASRLVDEDDDGDEHDGDQHEDGQHDGGEDHDD
jgi:hypothetical protein